MREIRFRGKVIGLDSDRDGKWVFGQLVIRPVHECSDDKYFICETGHRFIRCLNKMPCTYEVDPETVGQYTGLTDKNGKRIFEGDIVKHYNRMQEPEAYDVGCIYYDDVHCKWRRTKTDDVDKFNPEIRKNSKYEVIGNIHDNPELIAEVQDDI